MIKQKRVRTKKGSINYIDNKKFYEEMKKFKAACNEAEEAGQEYPKIPNYLGECFYKISNKLSNRPNFINYSYKEDMIGDGIEICIKYIKSFNPEKSNNPFAYFTQVVTNAFIHRINKEQKEQYVKYKSMETLVLNNGNFVMQAGDLPSHVLTTEFHDNTQRFIASFEESVANAKKKQAEKKNLEKFIED
jgi:hypothetical protein